MPALRLTPVARPVPDRGFALRFDGIVRLLLDWNQRRRQRMRLAALPDHMLKDIGISAADAAREAGKPFWQA